MIYFCSISGGPHSGDGADITNTSGSVSDCTGRQAAAVCYDGPGLTRERTPEIVRTTSRVEEPTPNLPHPVSIAKVAPSPLADVGALRTPGPATVRDHQRSCLVSKSLLCMCKSHLRQRYFFRLCEKLGRQASLKNSKPKPTPSSDRTHRKG